MYILLLLILLVSQSVMANYERPLMVIVPSYNNRNWCERNLDSIFMQRYSNYHLIYMDDCSTDGQYEFIKDFITMRGQEHRTTLVRNNGRRGALTNLYNAIHVTPDNAIVLTIDGDDFLKHDQVFAKINSAYQDPNVWMTYGQFEVWPHGTKGYCQEIPEQIVNGQYYREYPWVVSHLRTFYAWLFKQIKLKDLCHRTDFFSTSWDRAFIYPMLEMSAGRWKFIDEVLYLYNENNPLNDFRVHCLNQIRSRDIIIAREHYAPLPKDFVYRHDDTVLPVTLVSVSDNNPALMKQSLQSMQSHLKGVGEIIILYAATTSETDHYYQSLLQSPFAVRLIKFDETHALSDQLYTLATEGNKDFMLLTDDHVFVTHDIDLTSCVKALKKTHAYSFNFTLSADTHTSKRLKRAQRLPSLMQISHDIFGWQFLYAECDWRKLCGHMTLYRTSDIACHLEGAICYSYDQLEQFLAHANVGLDNFGLCFDKKKTVTI